MARAAAAKPEAAPAPSAQRGPKWSAIQPTIGAPTSVPPSATPTLSAITRPRICGSVESCIRPLVALPKVSVAAPMTASVAANAQ